METAVIAHSLAKRYRIGRRERYLTLRDEVGNLLRSPLRFTFARRNQDHIWALKDCSFEISQGEVVGLVGRNGAGKTTLLKVLSRITRPTRGCAEIRGRVGSLLEVGTGFHPELTGRENTFLSGAILGMTRREIRQKFDEIVAFAEIEKFIDTPVKHYSSGMYVRLAFAVAAHLEPEILLVDEVLAVGDINFQKKCLGKMSDEARAGRTIILVSHQLNQIRRLCSRAMWVDDGLIRMDGDAHKVVSAYEGAMASTGQSAIRETGSTAAQARFVRWEITGPARTDPHVLSSIGPVTMSFIAEIVRPFSNGMNGVALFNSDRQLIWARAVQNLRLEVGTHVFSYTFPSLPLRPGPYQWQVSLWSDGDMLDLWECIPELTIATDNHQHFSDHWNGVLNIPTDFEHGLPKGLHC